MLKDFVKVSKPDEEEFARRLEEERSKLFAAQMKIKEAGLPGMVIFLEEGEFHVYETGFPE